jgi:multidrug efflux system outer membrane protein
MTCLRQARKECSPLRKLALLASAGLLAGCADFAPPHVRPALPTATDYPAGYSGDKVPGQRATEVSLAQFLIDPRLEALVAQALQRNRDLAVAVARIEEARGLYRIQNADRLPTLDASGDVTASRQAGTTATRYALGVAVTGFELDFWGRVRNLSEAARSEYLATRQAERAFRLSLIRDVASAYFASREADERITLADATVRSRREAVRIAKRRLDAGVTSALDYRQSQSLLAQAETEAAGFRLARAQSDNLLAVLVGGPVAGPLPAPLPLAQQTATPALAAGLPSELLVARPDVLAAEERLRAARANIGAARAAFFPTISLTGAAGFASTALGSLFGGDGLAWSFGPTISLPIFDGGRNKGNLTVAQARENVAVATYEVTVQGAFREVADALAGRRYYAQQVEAGVRGVIAARQISRLTRLRYDEGVASYLDVLDAERTLFATEQQLILLRRAQADNLVSLYVALGGGIF